MVPLISVQIHTHESRHSPSMFLFQSFSYLVLPSVPFSPNSQFFISSQTQTGNNHHSSCRFLLPVLWLNFEFFFRSHNKLELGKKTTCRAHLVDDGPFAVAIGACMLTSLVFPVSDGQHEEDGDSAIDGTDTRFAVMGIVSFIPYFNWLSWVFAWLDTGRRRYAVYALVYLAPYLRSNLSISPEESWLPIASIIFCIIHIQLEASIRNGDIQGFRLFREVSNQMLSDNKKKDHLDHKKETSKLSPFVPSVAFPSSTTSSAVAFPHRLCQPSGFLLCQNLDQVLGQIWHVETIVYETGKHSYSDLCCRILWHSI